MDMPDTLYNDPRFLEVVRLLRGERRKQEAPPPDAEAPHDEGTRRVQAKINLRMKQWKTKKR
jgi:hypothetical protein